MHNPGMGFEIALSAATIPPTGLVQGQLGEGISRGIYYPQLHIIARHTTHYAV
jgi:hypothetical protein